MGISMGIINIGKDIDVIYTYGGGKILATIFNAIAMLIGAGSGRATIVVITLILATTGVAFSFAKLLVTADYKSFLFKSLLPAILLVGLFSIKPISVHIEDVINPLQSQKVSGVPWVLVKMASFISTTGHSIASEINTVIAGPNNETYKKTGMIFGGQSILDSSQYMIKDADTKLNLKSICKQCIFYDIKLGRYTADDIKQSDNLLDFLEANTAKNRLVNYVSKGSEKAVGEESSPKSVNKALSCQAAVIKLKESIGKEAGVYANDSIMGNLGNTYQAFTGKAAEDSEALIKQMVMISSINGAFDSGAFAVNRARSQQNSMYHTIGSLGATSIIGMMVVIEGMIYFLFIMVIPISVLPNGVKVLTEYAKLLIWIQTWPILFSILSLIMQTVAQDRAASFMLGNSGLNMFTSIGLANLQNDISSYANYLVISIPFLSYGIMKGGAALAHVGGSLMQPIQSVASMAANEKETGNYNFGNVSTGNLSHKNESQFQKNLAPSLNSGYSTENNGHGSMIRTSDGSTYFNQNGNSLRNNLSLSESLTDSTQNSVLSAQSETEGAQSNYTENVANTSKQVASLGHHLSDNKDFRESFSEKNGADVTNALMHLDSVGKEASDNETYSKQDASAIMFAGSLPGGRMASGSLSQGRVSSEALSNIEKYGAADSVQDSLQTVHGFLKNSNYSEGSDEGNRLTNDLSYSYDETKSSSEAYNVARQNLQTAQETHAWGSNYSINSNENLNEGLQAYVNDDGKFAQMVFKKDSSELDNVTSDYLTHIQLDYEKGSGLIDTQEQSNVFSSDTKNTIGDQRGLLGSHQEVNTFNNNKSELEDDYNSSEGKSDEEVNKGIVIEAKKEVFSEMPIMDSKKIISQEAYTGGVNEDTFNKAENGMKKTVALRSEKADKMVNIGNIAKGLKTGWRELAGNSNTAPIGRFPEGDVAEKRARHLANIAQKKADKEGV